MKPRNRNWISAALTLSLLALVSCLGEPEIDERWTLIEMQSVTPSPGQSTSASQPINVTVKSRLTYRKILTGFLVAEVRYSASIPPTSVALDPTRHTLEVAADIDRVLANSVTAGRATRPVTGFDHLMQDIDFSFTAAVPAAMMPGGTGPPVGGLYLVLYMGSGDEIQLAGNRDSLVVTPFVSTDYEVLHTGFALDVVAP